MAPRRKPAAPTYSQLFGDGSGASSSGPSSSDAVPDSQTSQRVSWSPPPPPQMPPPPPPAAAPQPAPAGILLGGSSPAGNFFQMSEKISGGKLSLKENTKKSKEEDGDSISESTQWRFFGLVIELLARMSSCESKQSQILEMSRWLSHGDEKVYGSAPPSSSSVIVARTKKERYDVLLGDSKEERYAALDPMDHPTFINNAPMSMGRKRNKLKERTAKLLLGEDMSGSGEGVCPAISNDQSLRKKLDHTRDFTNQILKACMSINSIALAEMEVPQAYLEALPEA
ncbi:hypothetical protein DY000_02021328 [Brassica cretica]|uniref:PRONE domain-containing protein n=1 Tax=Brassica cretica TaxID=69181 RepID=A0ABQ7E286_BRACR|nr:hypothetical protein DY000_02021328 [Brassica cretica]